MSKWIKLSAMAIAAIALVVLVYALLTPEPDTSESNHMGMWGGRMSYSSTNVGLIAASIAVIAIALMVALLWKEYEPLPPSMVPPAQREAAKPGPPADEGPESVSETGDLRGPPADKVAERNYLVLRLLTGDERLMFKAIMDSGGEALQKDLILKTRMSNAKVSRLLDKLAQKGVVTKERYGSTNKVRIKRD